MMKTLWPLLLVLFAAAACGDGARPSLDDAARGDAASTTTIPFRDDGDLTFLRSGEDVVTIDIEIADSDSARVRGLMQRTSLPEQSGMLFVFEREETQGFHMSNTPIALDLIFVSSDSQIVDVDKYNRPFSQTRIVSDAAAQYVVEVPAGFADTYGLVEGERVRWMRED